MFWKAFMGVDVEPEVCMEAGRSLLASQFLQLRASEERQHTGNREQEIKILQAGRKYIPDRKERSCKPHWLNTTFHDFISSKREQSCLLQDSGELEEF